MSNSDYGSGANTFGVGEYDVRYPPDPNADAGASEFSWGAGLDVPGYQNKPPSDGGRYKGKSPPCERIVGIGRDGAS